MICVPFPHTVKPHIAVKPYIAVTLQSNYKLQSNHTLQQASHDARPLTDANFHHGLEGRVYLATDMAEIR